MNEQWVTPETVTRQTELTPPPLQSYVTSISHCISKSSSKEDFPSDDFISVHSCRLSPVLTLLGLSASLGLEVFLIMSTLGADFCVSRFSASFPQK